MNNTAAADHLLHADPIFSPIFIPPSEQATIISTTNTSTSTNYLLPVPAPLAHHPHNINNSNTNNGGGSGGGGQRKVFVGGLSWETDEKSLRDYFSRYGAVSDCVIMRDRHTGHPRGFGFVTYEDDLVAERVACARHELDGRQVEAKRAVPRSECLPAYYPGSANASSPITNTSTNIAASLAAINNSNKKVFVGGLPATCGTDQFVAYFRKFGPISDAQVMYDHHTGNSRGFGFVTFQSQATVDLVVDAREHDIMGKFVDVKRAEPRQVLDARRRQKNTTNIIPATTAAAQPSAKPVSITPSLSAKLCNNNNNSNRKKKNSNNIYINSNDAGVVHDDGFGIFEHANPYSPQIAQTVHTNLFGSAAPPDIFSMFARPVASARVDRRYHPYASRERVSRSYW